MKGYQYRRKATGGGAPLNNLIFCFNCGKKTKQIKTTTASNFANRIVPSLNLMQNL